MVDRYVSDLPNNFRTPLGESIFKSKYAISTNETWLQRCQAIVDDVCGTRGGTTHPLMSKDDRRELVRLIHQFIFLPGGRYIYYAGRGVSFYNNCFIYKGEADTREEWGRLLHSASDALMSGGGIGIDYSVFRERGALLRRTGGVASGPIPLAMSINAVGKNVQQGGSRRSAIFASLDWQHGDANDWLKVKDWANTNVPGTYITYAEAKRNDFDASAPLDSTNISLGYNNQFLKEVIGRQFSTFDFQEWEVAVRDKSLPITFVNNVKMAMSNGEPGFAFNFFDKECETGRNAPISADTYVLTKGGYVQVREIVGEPTTLWTGVRWADNVVFAKTKSNVQTIAIEMTGGRVIKADPEHEFFVERWVGKGKKRKLMSIDKVPAGELLIGDTLHTSYPGVSEMGTNADYLTGYVYGDGTFKRGSSAEVTFCTPKAIGVCRELDDAGMFSSVNYASRGKYARAYISANMSIGGGDKNVCPTGATRQFIAGLFDADGSVDAVQNRVRLSSIRLSFLEGVRRELEVMGIMSHINTSGPSGYGGSDCYNLVVASEYISKFAEIIPTRILKIAPKGAYRASKIKVMSISPGDVEDVFCCDVGYEEHSFMADGVIISNCTEVTSSDDSDMCNLGSINMAACADKDVFNVALELASKFLVCGTIRATLPDEKSKKVREKNRRIGLGLMGLHEWLLQRGYRYAINDELRAWLADYQEVSERSANEHCDRFYLSRPVAYRAIAPTGTIGTIAGTTTGIEPLFAVAYKRRYIDGSRETGIERRRYQYYVDTAAQNLMDRYDVEPESIESAIDLAKDPERRIAFQADVQDYVDMAISSTLNLPEWGSEHNNEGLVDSFARIVAKYAPRLRGLTFYPDGSRGGQPLVSVPLSEAKEAGIGVVFEENSEKACKSGVCGI